MDKGLKSLLATIEQDSGADHGITNLVAAMSATADAIGALTALAIETDEEETERILRKLHKLLTEYSL